MKSWLHGSQRHSPEATLPTLLLVHHQANATIPMAPSQCICPNNAFMMMLFCCCYPDAILTTLSSHHYDSATPLSTLPSRCHRPSPAISIPPSCHSPNATYLLFHCHHPAIRRLLSQHCHPSFAVSALLQFHHCQLDAHFPPRSSRHYPAVPMPPSHYQDATIPAQPS